jgi:hypothetical protein
MTTPVSPAPATDANPTQTTPTPTLDPTPAGPPPVISTNSTHHTPVPSATDGDEVLGEGGKKALAAERARVKELNDRLKELEPLAKAHADAQESAKSETTKLNEALTSERDARTKAEVALLRHTIAADKGVPSDLVKFLTGSSKEEIEQSAAELLDAVGNNKPAMPGRPVERMVNGRPSTSSLDKDDPVTLIRKGRGELP